MAFITTTPAAQAAGPVLALYRREQDHYGYVPNYAKVFCHRPELMALWADLQRGIRRTVSPATFELVTLAAALALRSSYCCLAHGRMLTRHLPAETVLALVGEVNGDGAGAPGLTPADRARVRYAARVARDAASVTAEDVAELKRHGLDDAEIFDIAAVAAARAFLTKLVDGLGAAPDAPLQAIDAPLREAMTVGRPIEQIEPERLPREISSYPQPTDCL